MRKSDFNRRRFLKAGVLGILGAGALSSSRAPGQEDDLDLDFEMESEAPRIQKYNILGSTGLKVSDISLGMAREPSVLHYAYDQGINFFDTAESYYEGQHELDIGQAFKKIRDKVVITTKHHFGDGTRVKKQEILDRFDESLKRLGFDFVDIAMWHQADSPALFKNEEILSAYEALKKAGKYRHLGFSTHSAEQICPLAYETKLFSNMMVIYNSVQNPERSEIITQAKKLGIGVIAMKTMMGREQDNVAELADERTTYSQAAVKWALTDEAVTSVVLSMQSYEHIDEYLKASGRKLTQQDEQVLKKYVKAVDDRYCRVGCKDCLAACPHRVAIHDVMRFGMYYENYSQEKHAMQQYARLNERERATACKTCSGLCEGACPHNLSIRDRLVRYDGLLRI
ncbi:MAG: aldo/keto reductase [Planctomycetes bacterium]|nr:aldo/keto reductase [Planctomycetota bacterium]